jgi:transitional endoplasmic reticulum ATPase
MLRPGRFDRLIYVPPPDEKSRIEIFNIYTKKMPLSDDVDVKYLASVCKGYSGADIKSLCIEAAINALRRDIAESKVTARDFAEAMSKIAPSVTPEMESWYRNISQQFKKVVKPATPIA